MSFLKSFRRFLDINRETLKGKSFSRTLANLKLRERNITLSGRILDLGGRALFMEKGEVRGASYLRFLKFGNVEILKLDIDKETQPDHAIDFEKDPLPFEDNSIDAVLVFNLLEHIYNYKFLAKEIFRVLKPGALALGSVPFLLRIHPDPKDFFRYSRAALEQVFKEADFKEIEIEYVGYGPFISQYAQSEFVFPRVCRLILIPINILLDKIIFKLKPSFADKFPLDYVFILRK